MPRYHIPSDLSTEKTVKDFFDLTCAFLLLRYYIPMSKFITHKKVGGITFVKIGRISLAFSVKRKKRVVKEKRISHAVNLVLTES